MHSAEKKNIVICGYQKSGTIWATRLIAELLECPSVGYWGHPEPYSVTEGLGRKSVYACYQSHHTHKELSELESSKIHKLIYLVRDPRDIWVSGINHFNFERPWFTKLVKALPQGSLKTGLKKLHQKLLTGTYRKQRMLNMLFHGDQQILHAHSSWKKHVESHQQNTDLLMIRYEDLLQDGLAACRQVLDHLKAYAITDKHIYTCIDKQSFDRRKKEFKNENEKVKFKHLRKGMAGDWKNHLSNSDCHVLASQLGTPMTVLGYLSKGTDFLRS